MAVLKRRLFLLISLCHIVLHSKETGESTRRNTSNVSTTIPYSSLSFALDLLPLASLTLVMPTNLKRKKSSNKSRKPAFNRGTAKHIAGRKIYAHDGNPIHNLDPYHLNAGGQTYNSAGKKIRTQVRIETRLKHLFDRIRQTPSICITIRHHRPPPVSRKVVKSRGVVLDWQAQALTSRPNHLALERTICYRIITHRRLFVILPTSTNTSAWKPTILAPGTWERIAMYGELTAM